jgi:hypothetical protein
MGMKPADIPEKAKDKSPLNQRAYYFGKYG